MRPGPLRFGLVALALALATACANPEEPDRPMRDGGALRDGGGTRDAGEPGDGGEPRDAGPTRDAGPDRDGGPGRVEVRQTRLAPSVGHTARPGVEVRGRLGISGPQRAASAGHEVRGGLVTSRPSDTP